MKNLFENLPLHEESNENMGSYIFENVKGSDNIHERIEGLDELKKFMREEAEYHLGKFLDNLGIDWKNDPSMKETPERVTRMFFETLHGRYDPEPKITEFPNTMKIDQMYCVGPVDIRSMCSHHLVPIIGKAWFGIVLNKESNILGLSKFARIADWIFARPHMQEEATAMLADKLETICKPRGLALIVKAKHGYTIWRGVKAENSVMVTSEMRGVMRDTAPRMEFLETIKGMNYENI